MFSELDDVGNMVVQNATQRSNMQTWSSTETNWSAADSDLYMQYSDEVQQLIDDFNAAKWTYKESGNLCRIILYIPIFLTAFTGNFLIILFVSCFSGKTRTVTNFFLVNLCVSDILLALVNMPTEVVRNVYTDWLGGEALCKITALVQGVAACSSVLTITAMSVERLLAIRYTFTYRKVFVARTLKFLLAIIWSFAVIMALPIGFVRQLDRFVLIPGEETEFCVESGWADPPLKQWYKKLYAVFLAVTFQLIPAITTISCYCVMGCTLCASQSVHINGSAGGSVDDNAKRLMKGRRRVAKLLIILSVIFAVCWTPYNALCLALDVGLVSTETEQELLVYFPYTLMIGHLNSALNPILYSFINKKFRFYVLNLFTRMSCQPTGFSTNGHSQLGQKQKSSSASRFSLLKCSTGEASSGGGTVVAPGLFCSVNYTSRLEVVNSRSARLSDYFSRMKQTYRLHQSSRRTPSHPSHSTHRNSPLDELPPSSPDWYHPVSNGGAVNFETNEHRAVANGVRPEECETCLPVTAVVIASGPTDSGVTTHLYGSSAARNDEVERVITLDGLLETAI